MADVDIERARQDDESHDEDVPMGCERCMRELQSVGRWPSCGP